MEKTAEAINFKQYLEIILEWLRGLGFSFSQDNIAWSSAQIALILVAFLIASLGKKIIGKHLDNSIERVGRASWSGKLLNRLRLSIWGLVLAVTLWAMVMVMQQITWSSRSHLLLSAASLATAWLVISIVTKFIHNRTVSKIVATVAWSVAALNIVGLLPSTLSMLDQAAIQFDTFRLSVLTVFKGVAVFSLLIWAALAAGRFTDERLGAIDGLSPSLKVLTGKIIKSALLIVAIFGGLNLIGIDFSALAVFSGAIGLGIGFGLQKVVSNLISGFILLTDKSIKPGDVISVGDTYGRIDQLAARYVSVRARDGREYLVPNEDLITNPVINWTFSALRVRLDVPFGVSYKSDPHEVREVAKKAAATVKRVMKDPAPVCHIVKFDDSSINLLLRFWITDPDKGTTNIRGDVFLALWDALKEAGIEIPYPHRQVLVDQSIEVSSVKD